LGDVYVFNDGGDYTIEGAVNKQNPQRLGKAGYWNTVNALFSMRGNHKYYIMLPDDFMPRPEIVIESLRLWSEIKDPRKICMSLAEPRTIPCWTGFMPVEKYGVIQSQWVDMCFLCEESFFSILGRIPPLIRTTNGYVRRGSSGIGAYISRFFHKRKYNMYQVKESLVEIQAEHYKSQMNDTTSYSWHSVSPRKTRPVKKGRRKF
jgi:hypothetical protein